MKLFYKKDIFFFVTRFDVVDIKIEKFDIVF